LPRQQRRRVDRELRKLMHGDVCSICGSRLKHNSRTTSGFDEQGNVVLAGECCVDRVTVTFGHGLYTDRQYDFLSSRKSKSIIDLTPKQIADAIAAFQKIIASTDEALADVERRGGGIRAQNVVTQDHPWKIDDRDWFQRNQSRSHRARMPFPGEFDEEKIKASAECALVMLIRQIESNVRLKAVVDLSTDLLPVPDDDATIHALFEASRGYEVMPHNHEALRALAAKYTVRGVS